MSSYSLIIYQAVKEEREHAGIGIAEYKRYNLHLTQPAPVSSRLVLRAILKGQ